MRLPRRSQSNGGVSEVQAPAVCSEVQAPEVQLPAVCSAAGCHVFGVALNGEEEGKRGVAVLCEGRPL